MGMSLYCVTHQIYLEIDKNTRRINLPPIGRRFPTVRCALLLNDGVERDERLVSEGKACVPVVDVDGTPTSYTCEVELR
jgi:hypothetical protein